MMMFYKFFGKNFLRQRLLAITSSPEMRLFLEKNYPTEKTLVSDSKIISLDIETTGLDLEKDEIISIGLVEINNLNIELASSWHQIVQVKQTMQEENVVIHQITDDQSKAGMSIAQAMPLLLERIKGNVILAHNAAIEQGFINKACLALYQTPFVIPIIDTQVLAKRMLDRRNAVYQNNDLRLFNLRKEFNLPAYKAHNALLDAVATAELFIAIINENYPQNNARLKDCLS